MAEGTGQSTSIWMPAKAPRFPALASDASADVCVIGAGIAGMSTAYLLALEGKSVIVMDDGPLAGGQTQRTTAHLSNAIDARYFEIERLHGEGGARLTAQSHSAAIDCIERIVARERIDCGFERVDGYLFLAPEHSARMLDQELAAAHRAGLETVERLEATPFPHLHVGECLRFPSQGQFHPLQYLSGVAEALQRRGGRIFSGTHAHEISGGTTARVRTDAGFTVSAAAVVVATNTPVNDKVAIHTKQAAYRTYVISVRVPAGSAPRALFWDTHDPYHYVRALSSAEGPGSDGFDWLIVGGEDHKTGQSNDASDRYRRLEEWARARFGITASAEYRWSGQVFETIDGLAFIGRNPLDSENVYVVTGDCGMGMTHGTIAGVLLTDLIMQRDNPWASLYDPSRKTLKAAMEYARENTNTAWQYTDWLTPGEVSSVGEVKPGCGAILRRGLAKVAVYRDDDSAIYELSAICPHLGGVVQWNSSEHSWDCPCHGARFDAYGRVITGPANSDLQPVEEPHSEADFPMGDVHARGGPPAAEHHHRRQDVPSGERGPG